MKILSLVALFLCVLTVLAKNEAPSQEVDYQALAKEYFDKFVVFVKHTQAEAKVLATQHAKDVDFLKPYVEEVGLAAFWGVVVLPSLVLLYLLSSICGGSSKPKTKKSDKAASSQKTKKNK
eukprot:TRINITY_DN493_c0_g1_i1.p2 TRINITY_DN493_c0_g1~~TRINITY_DN493_c0_g1_i1.p2  ORF type:complete len:121 (-),score=39.50 TRINITY_DN493_c0_g1_i1:845-1207(-)